MAERKVNAMTRLLADAGKKVVKAAKEYDGNPFDAEYNLLFAIAENTSVIAALLYDAMTEENDEQGSAD